MLLNKQQIYIIPASCVIKDGKALLFLGDFWQGKTSAALSVLSLDKSIKLVSDNYIAVSNNYVIWWTKYLSLREENTERYKHIIKSQKAKTVDSRNFFKFKTSKTKWEIIGFVIPYINNWDDNFHILPDHDALRYLYQKFSRIINWDTLLFNWDIPSPNFDTKILAKNRLIFTKQILNNNLYYASADIMKIANYSLDLLKNKNHE